MNCHLAITWLPILEKLQEPKVDDSDINHLYRLWLTSLPINKFPVSIL